MKKPVLHMAPALALATCLPFAHALEPAELFEKVSPSVWGVQTEDAQGRKLAAGSAVVIGPGRLVTNCHVLAKARSFVVKKENVTYGATLEFPDPDRDLCQIRVSNFNAPAVEVADMQKLRVGSKVFAIGNPRGLETTLSDGLISGLRKSESGELEAVQTTAPISPGSSGGGLFDTDGRLVGLTTAALRDSQNLNFALPGSWITAVPERGQAALARRGTTGSAAAAAGSAAVQAPAVAALRPDAGAGDLRVGDAFEYTLVDRMVRKDQTVTYRVERIEGDKVVFNNGARIERTNGDLLEISTPVAVELDAATPPSGWGPESVRTGQRLRFTRPISGGTHLYEMIPTVGEVREVTTPAGTFKAVQIDLRGWTTRTLTAAGNSRVIAPYRATVWYATDLKRVIRFSVKTASARNNGVATFVVDETLELARMIKG